MWNGPTVETNMENMIVGKEITVPGHFRVTIPKAWSWKLEDGFVISHPAIDGSGLFVEGDYVELTSETVLERLKDIAEDFVNKHIAKGEPDAVLDANAISESDGEQQYTFRSLLTARERSWIVQVVARVDRRLYYLIHWCGPRDVLNRYIIPVLDTFEILGEQPQEQKTGQV